MTDRQISCLKLLKRPRDGYSYSDLVNQGVLRVTLRSLETKGFVVHALVRNPSNGFGELVFWLTNTGYDELRSIRADARKVLTNG